MEQPTTNTIDHEWYMRPVFFVSDVQRAIEFYVGKLGFTKKWHEADGKGTVCQVDRGGCEIILCEDPHRDDRGRLFLELSREGVDQLPRKSTSDLFRHRRRGGGTKCFKLKTRMATIFLSASRISYQSGIHRAIDMFSCTMSRVRRGRLAGAAECARRSCEC